MIEQDEELDMTTDQALISALTPKQVGEIELKPFSLMRQVISIDLCRTSKGHFFNAIMTVWVCTLEPLEALQAHEDIRAAQVRAFEWAEAQGYSIQNYQSLLDAYAKLNRELGASTGARVRDGDGNNAKNDGGQPRS